MSVPQDVRDRWHARFQNRDVKAKPAVPGLTIRDAGASTAEILLYDEIGFWGVTASDFRNQLAGVTAKNITVRINSPGGEVFDGMAIYNALKAHSATVTTVVDGIAASAASFVALAGDTVTMSGTSFMMIHKAAGLCMGNDTDMVAMSALLTKIDGQIANIYSAKTGKPVAEMLAQMAAETWFTADEAVAAKMADQVADPDADAGATARAEQLARLNMMRRTFQLAEFADV